MQYQSVRRNKRGKRGSCDKRFTLPSQQARYWIYHLCNIATSWYPLTFSECYEVAGIGDTKPLYYGVIYWLIHLIAFYIRHSFRRRRTADWNHLWPCEYLFHFFCFPVFSFRKHITTVLYRKTYCYYFLLPRSGIMQWNSPGRQHSAMERWAIMLQFCCKFTSVSVCQNL